ncbi:MAG: hypothetical protein ACRDU4_03700 [Mycobacterium sp.]
MVDRSDELLFVVDRPDERSFAVDRSDAFVRYGDCPLVVSVPGVAGAGEPGIR